MEMSKEKMKLLPGVYVAVKKDGTVYYRASLTKFGKHISLGSYETEADAHKAYTEAQLLLNDPSISIIDHQRNEVLPFEKRVTIINVRDNKLYSPNPIYIRKKMIEYYMSSREILKFDSDLFFYFSSHKIMKRGGHYFAADTGLQVNVLNRVGIKNYAVEGRDYRFINGDRTDFRSANLEIINRFTGVRRIKKGGRDLCRTVIHINGDFIVGDYEDELTAAVAYNKAADTLNALGLKKNFFRNDIAELDEGSYKELYKSIKISKKLFRTEIYLNE